MKPSFHSTRALALTALLACSIRELPADSASDTAEPGSTSTTATTTATTPGTTTSDPFPATTTSPPPQTTGTTAGDDPGQTFIAPEDIPGSNDCFAWTVPSPDCPAGQKCTIEDDIQDTHCVDVVDDPKQMYEPCQVLDGGPMSGHDDCDEGLLCWDVDPDTGVGRCIGFCQSVEAWDCVDPGATCSSCQDCAVGLCLPGCDPRLKDCPNEQVCIYNSSDPDFFACVIDGSGDEGQVFDLCEFANACDPGLLCVNPELAAECEQNTAGCCLPVCDLDVMPPACPGAGQQCLPWHEQGQAPPGLENLGICGIPQ